MDDRQSIEKAVEIAREIRARERFNKIDFYDPYPYQKNFHDTGGGANPGYIPSGGKAVGIDSL